MPLTLRPKKSPRPNSVVVVEPPLGDFAAVSPSYLDLSSPSNTKTYHTLPSVRTLDTPRLVISSDYTDSPDTFEPPNLLGLEPSMPEDLDQSAVYVGGDGRPEGRNPHRDSIVQRVAVNSPTGNGKKSYRSKRSRSRRASTSSAISQGNTIAAALTKSSLQVAATMPAEDIAPKAQTQSSAQLRSVSTGRSPYLIRAHETDSDDGYGSENESAEESDEEGIDHLPVTGFAVASNRRNTEFHALFPTVDEGDYLIEDYGCALAKDILVHGRLYVSENHICFHSNLFGWVTDVIVPFADVQEIEKKMTALVIPNAIGIVTAKERYTFASLISRDSTFDVLMNIWRIAHPGAVMTQSAAPNSSRPPSVVDAATPQVAVVHKSTECACGKAGKHYSETALDTTFPSSPEKVYNLMFNSGWYRNFLSENQKLRDIESSDWRPDKDKDDKLTRSTTYIKPLNGSIGPKQTKCHIVDEHEHCDFDDYISMVTTTRTPDVPSGGVFSVKTRTCFTWAGATSTRVKVTTEVEWTGKSWVKGIIEKSAIDGQKQYHDDLATEMRAHMKEHPTEFAVAGAEIVEPTEEEAAATGPPATSPTEAQEYAAQNRRARQDADYWLLQGAFDSIWSGAKSIASGLGTGFNTVSDLVGDAPISKTAIMAILLTILLGSNFYTYFTRPASQHKQKRLQRFGPSEDEVADALRLILAKRLAATPKEEVSELLRLLDEIDSRSARLRHALVGQQEGKNDGGDDLDDLD